MKSLNLMDVTQYVEANISTFHQKRIASLNQLKLKTVLKKKNPYLFRAKYQESADQIVRSFADAFISSNEETIFGDWLEGLAIFINSKVYDGRKSGINDEFMQSYHRMLNKFNLEFLQELCDATHAIDWHKLVQFNSGRA